MTTRAADGTIYQSSLMAQPGDYDHERINYPVLGIVTALHVSDDPFNAVTAPTSSQRGSAATCDVYVVGHGNDNPWVIPNVVILPRGPTGVDDFCEDLPRPANFMVDGSQINGNIGSLDLTKIDADWCVVAFIGGSIQSPIMLSWFPHPGNVTDPATFGFPLQPAQSGQSDAKTLNQGRRSFRRVAGLKATVTSQGSLFLDTNESNAKVTGDKDTGRIKRDGRDDGGDVQLDIKKTRQLQVNFNPPVAQPKKQPSLPQANPPDSGPQQDRETKLTAVTLDKKNIEMIAGEVVRLLTNDKNIEIHAKTKVTIMGEDSTDNTLLGSDDASACDHAVSGETFFQNRYDVLVNALKNHTHNTSVGPTDVPVNAAAFPASQSADLSGVVMVKKK